MSIEYVNRRGDRYYLLQGETKTGKPKYYCSRKSSGVPVERLPDGFELHESPANGMVSVRKIRPTRIMPWERECVVRLAKQLAVGSDVIVDVDGDSLVVYASDADPQGMTKTLDRFLGFGAVPAGKVHEMIAKTSQYSATLRFTLTDEEERRYSAERWCWRGRIDNWIPLAYEMDLEGLLKKYLPHVGRESFFELI